MSDAAGQCPRCEAICRFIVTDLETLSERTEIAVNLLFELRTVDARRAGEWQQKYEWLRADLINRGVAP